MGRASDKTARTRDPCKDCWSWNQLHRPDLWRQHIQALQSNNISQARLTYNSMTAAWSAATTRS